MTDLTVFDKHKRTTNKNYTAHENKQDIILTKRDKKIMNISGNNYGGQSEPCNTKHKDTKLINDNQEARGETL